MLCPRVLTAGRWHLFHPRAALTVWFGAFGVGIATALAGIALGIVAVESLRHAIPHTTSVTVSAAIWVAAGISGAFLVFVFTFAGSLQSLRPASHSHAVAYARDEHIGFTLVRFHSEKPEAYAVPGRRPEIFVSSAMEQLLTPPQLQAVLAHEFAHLRHQHGLAIRIAQLNALLLPSCVPAERSNAPPACKSSSLLTMRPHVRSALHTSQMRSLSSRPQHTTSA